MGYRSEDEIKQWVCRDQVKRVGEFLGPDKRRQIEKEIEEQIRRAFDFAEESPFPRGPALHEDVFR